MSHLKEENGFTLIELMLAIFIMTIGLVSTMKMMSNFRDASLISRDQVTALNIGVRKMEDLLGKSFYYDFTTSAYVIDSDLSSGCHEDPDGNKLVDACVPDSDSSGGGGAINANVYFDKFYVGWDCTAPATTDAYLTANNIISITMTVSWNYFGTTKSLQFITLKAAN